MQKKSIFRYTFLLEQLVKRNFNTKYRQSVLGVLWSFLNPLMTMAVQYLVFSQLFRSDISHFPVYLLTGIILFSFFNECVTLGMDSIVLNGPLITKVAMPKLIYPLSRSISSFISLVISLVPLLGAMLLSGTPLTPALLLIPAAMVLLFLFSLGMSLILCTLNVFFRDTRFLWSVVSLLWTYATPIFYPISIIPAACGRSSSRGHGPPGGSGAHARCARRCRWRWGCSSSAGMSTNSFSICKGGAPCPI